MAKEYYQAETLEKKAKELIAKYHPELATAEIGYFWVTEGTVKGSRRICGEVKKLSPLLKTVCGLDFLLIMAQDFWSEMTAEAQQAALDSQLEACTGEEDKSGAMVWKIRPPDLQLHTETLRRWGAWTDDLQNFCSVAKELDLSAKVEELLN